MVFPSHRFVGWLISAALLAFCGFTLLHSTGQVGTTPKPGSFLYGCLCHDENPSPFVGVYIDGPESLGLGQTGLFRLTVAKDTNIAAGFNLATFFGTLAPGDSSEQWMFDDELTHAFPKLSENGDSISWTFYYEAPEVSLFDTLYATGMSVDLSFDPSGDYWNFGEKFIVRVGNPVNVGDPTPPPVAFRLHQNFPNPFNASTRIGFTLQTPGFTSVKVYDVLGREVATLIEEALFSGDHTFVWDAGGFASGIYLYRLTFGTQSETRKLIHLR